jgi:hypothetical protein
MTLGRLSSDTFAHLLPLICLSSQFIGIPFGARVKRQIRKRDTLGRQFSERAVTHAEALFFVECQALHLVLTRVFACNLLTRRGISLRPPPFVPLVVSHQQKQRMIMMRRKRRRRLCAGVAFTLVCGCY